MDTDLVVDFHVWEVRAVFMLEKVLLEAKRYSKGLATFVSGLKLRFYRCT